MLATKQIQKKATIHLLDAQGTLITSAYTINDRATHVMGIFAASVAEIFRLFFLVLVFAIIPTTANANFI